MNTAVENITSIVVKDIIEETSTVDEEQILLLHRIKVKISLKIDNIRYSLPMPT